MSCTGTTHRYSLLHCNREFDIHNCTSVYDILEKWSLLYNTVSTLWAEYHTRWLSRMYKI